MEREMRMRYSVTWIDEDHVHSAVDYDAPQAYNVRRFSQLEKASVYCRTNEKDVHCKISEWRNQLNGGRCTDGSSVE